MTDVATPLQYGDPPRLGPFVVHARLHTLPAGFVYLGQAPDGRVVSLAVLTRGAAVDAAARERFVTAIREGTRDAARERGRVRSLLGGRASAAPPVMALDDGGAPWVAVPYVPGGPGAECFLDPVYVTGTFIGDRHGPDFVPYWVADRAPAIPPPAPPKPPPVETPRSVILASAVLALLVLLLALMAWLLLGREEDPETPPRPLPPTMFVPTPPPVPASPLPVEPSPSPTDGPGGSGSPAPSQGGGPEGEI